MITVKSTQLQQRNTKSYNGRPIRITTDLSTETLKARKEWENVTQFLKDNNC